MYALKVRINDEAPVIAGADDLGVLNAAISCVGKLGTGSRPVREDESADLFMTVGGLTSRASDVPDEHLNWVSQRPLKIGDVISVEVLDTPKADAPIGGREAEKRQHDEREYFEHCKKVYLSLRDRYEAQ
ncbi:MAG: hypothetical protein EOP92_19550 [Lysobacteraceae bacterium]|nr:MAG: hypothetical protein EOP92_19550 [Xanthomonadaceae bacterium]